MMNLNGLTINFLGDSITEGTGVTDRANCRFDNRLVKLCNLAKANNYGIGGTRLAHQIHPSEKPRYDLCFCGRAYRRARRKRKTFGSKLNKTDARGRDQSYNGRYGKRP